MNARQTIFKSILWWIMGVFAVVTVARFVNGLGSATALNDGAPWGFWIAFDVMAGVALAAGGFVVAATVHIFHLKKYEAFARPAILTALIGYAAVALGLMYDLGLPWHIWHPMIFPQVHSVLFEVAMCVMLYLTVLFLEFAPVILEHPLFAWPLFKSIHSLLKRVGVPLVIAGIVLSTLHQSSLGSLFLITPYRLHALWYSPIIWIQFFISAIGLGLMTVTLESFFSAWFFRHRLRMDLLSGLARAGSIVLLLYAAVRFADLDIRGKLGAAFDGSAQANLFLFEMAVAAVIPGVLLAFPKVRNNAKALGTLAFLSVMGVIGYRFDVCIVAFARPEGTTYFPTWLEVAVSLGIVAAGLLTFLFAVQHLKVYPQDHVEPQAPQAGRAARRFEPAVVRSMLPESLAAPRRASLAVLTGAALAVAFLPQDALFGARPLPAPVQLSRTVDAWVLPRSGAFGHDFILPGPDGTPPAGAQAAALTMIDGNRDGRLVLFNHQRHEDVLGGDGACVLCHHQDMPFHENTECYLCHRDMYSVTDIFDHSSHVAWLDGNAGCARCHTDPDAVRSRATAMPCLECHVDMVAAGARVKLPAEGMTGLAPGYMEAMHELCVRCHEEKAATEPGKYPLELGECRTCHRDIGEVDLKRRWPYLTKEGP
ncbi:MAG: Ni/Fe-hydrogenase cytochrome b subunit [Planctomycetes bacterium]|nr:Ni/Fe-hydrogenase cytochrome b subunit [Planctomycetota bacterium]